MTVAELKTELKKLDLSQAGKKADLVERLSGALGGGRRLAESAGASCAIPFGETPYTPLPPPLPRCGRQSCARCSICPSSRR